jgi:WD40 repeat protein
MPSDADQAPDRSEFWAFVSYSHADRAWADWLHRALERYRIPRRLVGVTTPSGPVPARIAPVFLDRVELAASTDLDASMADALRASRSLIVICSPAAAASRRVIQEIEVFQELKKGRVLCLIVAGRPNAEKRGGGTAEECFPPPLRSLPATGNGKFAAPLAADARPGKGGRQEALLKLVAGILNLNLDQLRQRDVQRRRVRWVAALALSLTGMVSASALGLYAWSQRNAAVQAESGLLIEAATQRLKDLDVASARGIVLEVLSNPKFSNGHTEAAINVFQEVRAADAQISVLSGHSDFVRSAGYSPDGTRIVTASDDGTARIWNSRTGAELAVLAGHTNRVGSAAYSPDGRYLVTASSDKTARIWDARTGAPLAVLSGHTDALYSAAYSPDGTRIVTASNDKTARIWDARAGAQLAVLSGHDDRVQSAAFSPDGTRIVTASWDKTARIWDARTGAPLAVLSGHGNLVYSAAYSPDGLRVVTASWDKTARIWDARTGAQLAVLSGHTNFVESAAYSPDGLRIVTASHDRTARIWDASTGAQLAALSGHADRLESAAYSHDGMRIVTASLDKTARVWDAGSGAQLALLALHDGSVGSAKYSPDDTRILTASADKTARIWDARSGKQLAVLSHGAPVSSADYSPDGMRIATASYDKTVWIWDASLGKQLGQLTGHDGTVYSAAFSPDGTRIVTASGDKTARIWDAHSGMQLVLLSGHTGSVQWAVYSPDATRIVTASLDKTARVWDARSGKQLVVLSGHGGSIACAAYSPDGARIVTASVDKTARIWDAQTGALLAVLAGHGGVVESVAYSPDGKHIVTASSDNTIRIWDAGTGAQLEVLSGHGNVVETAAYSWDGTRIVSASDDKTARIWDARIPATIATQILWYRAAETDPLADGDRIQLGLPLDARTKDWSQEGSACDRSAAAYDDPNRLAQGVSQAKLNTDIANSDCTRAMAITNHTVRTDYQMGRALLAKRDIDGARRQFESSAKAYPAARVDLANLLIDPMAGSPDILRAISLYETAWQYGVQIAAFQLGQLYEIGAKGTASSSRDPVKAWSWYQKAADAGEPHALARFAERQEGNAEAESDPAHSDALLLEAFSYYAAATERAKKEGWPDEAWSHWRYRRATLARLLARDGMMQPVADTYAKAKKRSSL